MFRCNRRLPVTSMLGFIWSGFKFVLYRWLLLLGPFIGPRGTLQLRVRMTWMAIEAFQRYAPDHEEHIKALRYTHINQLSYLDAYDRGAYTAREAQLMMNIASLYGLLRIEAARKAAAAGKKNE